MTPRQWKSDPKDWLPVAPYELADLVDRYGTGFLSDLVSIRRNVVLRLVAEINRRTLPVPVEPTKEPTMEAAPAVEVMPPPADPKPWEAVPDGDFAIVELFGHTTLVGRIAEVERFGTKMLALEPLFNGQMLGTVFHGGASIYRLTPCTREVAWAKQPKDTFNLPAPIRATIPPSLLPAPAQPAARYAHDDDGDPGF